jgi:hypothetical protein
MDDTLKGETCAATFEGIPILTARQALEKLGISAVSV